MKKILMIVAITGAFTSCGNGNENSAGSDTNTNSISPLPPPDTTTLIAPMMGDTAKTDADSLEK